MFLVSSSKRWVFFKVLDLFENHGKNCGNTKFYLPVPSHSLLFLFTFLQPSGFYIVTLNVKFSGWHCVCFKQ